MRATTAILILGSCLLFAALSSRATQTARQLESDIQGLYSNNAEFRAQARARLVEAGPQAVPLLLPVVCQASKSNSDSAWREAAKAIGELRAEAGALCLVRLLASDLTLNVFASEDTIAASDAAYVALLQIGDPSVGAISTALPSLHPDQAYLALRILRRIGTPKARAAVEAYLHGLENQTRLAREILSDFH
jgi:hypothetical protein